MTVSLCTNCGSLKHGAWCVCPTCQVESFDADLSILLSDHYLTARELKDIGQAIGEIYSTDMDEDTRFMALLYFLARKWPKLSRFDIDELRQPLRDKLDTLYKERLQGLPEQESPDLELSPVLMSNWTRAMGDDLQAEENEWQQQVASVLRLGFRVAEQVVGLHIEMGEGAVLQKIRHLFQSLVERKNYGEMAARAEQLIGDAKQYQRNVDRFCTAVKNGWSGRTQQQAAYFRGTCQRLIEMAHYCNEIGKHKARVEPVIKLDLTRIRQQFKVSYRTFCDLARVVADPRKIKSSPLSIE